MVSKETELIVNSISTIVLFFSFLILLFLSYRLLKHSEKSYIETTFGSATAIAAFASLEASIFRFFYIIYSSGPLVDTWIIAAFFYYILMSLSLSLILVVSLGILGGKKYFKIGFLMVLAIIPIILGFWFFEGAVTFESGIANTNMNLIGVISIFGILSLQVFVNTALYYYIYSKTKNRGALDVCLGMLIIAISAAEGGVSDILGYYGRLLDPIGYIGVLVGVYFVMTGVEILNSDFSQFLPFFTKISRK